MDLARESKSLSEMVKDYAASEKLNLPVFPEVATELQSLLSNDSTTIDEIAHVIGKDQAMTSRILRMANSAFFSGLKQVNTIKDAIMRLGVNQIYNCLILAQQQDYHKSKDNFMNQYLQGLWKHALCTAVGSKWLLQKIGYRELADQGFLAGLLHDVGKLLIIKAIEAITSEDESVRFPGAFISEVLESMHAEQGYLLMKEWTIPVEFCKVVRDHHFEEFDTEDPLLLAVRIVDQVCRQFGVSTKPEIQLIPASLPEVHVLGVKPIVLAELEVVIEDTLSLQIP
ncbi:MAG: HDOD domain-containing protein [Syntrophobacteraceae bacterium]